MHALLYFMDTFEPFEADPNRLIKNPASASEALRRRVEKEGLSVDRVRPFALLSEEGVVVAEYVAELVSGGSVSLKLIFAEDPLGALERYYIAEREGRLVSYKED